MEDRDRDFIAKLESMGEPAVRDRVQMGRDSAFGGRNRSVAVAWLAQKDQARKDVEIDLQSRAASAAERAAAAAERAADAAHRANTIAIVAAVMAAIAIGVSIFSLVAGQGS